MVWVGFKFGLDDSDFHKDKSIINLSNYEFDFEETPSKNPNAGGINDSELQEKSIEKMNKEIQDMKREFLEKNDVINDKSEDLEEPNKENLETKMRKNTENTQIEHKDTPNSKNNLSSPENTQNLNEPLKSEGSIKSPIPKSNTSKSSQSHQNLFNEPSLSLPPKPDEEPEPVIPDELPSFSSPPISLNSSKANKTMLPALKTPKRSPMLLPSEKELAVNFGQSLDSKKIDETITELGTDNICKCLAHAVLKHIEFSKGEVLVDDLVGDEEDIPQFSYEFGEDLRIDLDEIHHRKEMEQWEAQAKNYENFHKMEYFMNEGMDPNQIQFMEHGQVFDYEMHHHQQQINNPQPSLLGDLPPLNVGQNPSGNKFSSYTDSGNNTDLVVNEDPTDEGYNYSLVQMDDFLKDQGLFGKDSTNLVNTYYSNLSNTGYTKPCYMPPPDLGMIESLGSFENTTKYLGSAKSSKKMKNEESKSVKSNKSLKSNATHKPNKSNISHEMPLEEMRSFDSNENSTSGIRGGSVRNIETPSSDHSHHSEVYTEISNQDEKNSLTQESYYMLEDITKEGLQKFLKEAMIVFNERYSVLKKQIEEDVEVMPPTFDLVYKYCKYVVLAAKMEKEIPILALVYLERLITRTGVLMNNLNWRRLMLTTL